jgi:hypothetical protein
MRRECVTSQNAIDALALENRRFNEIMRSFDGGIWWSSDATAQIDVDAICAQAAHIKIALDEITRLAKNIAE